MRNLIHIIILLSGLLLHLIISDPYFYSKLERLAEFPSGWMYVGRYLRIWLWRTMILDVGYIILFLSVAYQFIIFPMGIRYRWFVFRYTFWHSVNASVFTLVAIRLIGMM